MNGLELTAWTLSNRPGVKVLVTTGTSRIEVPTEIVEPLLAKPHTGRDLLDRIKQALATRPGDAAHRRRVFLHAHSGAKCSLVGPGPFCNGC